MNPHAQAAENNSHKKIESEAAEKSSRTGNTGLAEARASAWAKRDKSGPSPAEKLAKAAPAIAGEATVQIAATALGEMGDHYLSLVKSLNDFRDATTSDYLYPIKAGWNLTCNLAKQGMEYERQKWITEPLAVVNTSRQYLEHGTWSAAHNLASAISASCLIPKTGEAAISYALSPDARRLQGFSPAVTRNLHIQNSVSALTDYLKKPSELNRANLSCTIGSDLGPPTANATELLVTLGVQEADH